MGPPIAILNGKGIHNLARSIRSRPPIILVIAGLTEKLSTTGPKRNGWPQA